jgi:cytoskeletal protein CcmA (bactofilin family)
VGYIVHFRAAKGDNETARILRVDGKVFGKKATEGKLDITQ